MCIWFQTFGCVHDNHLMIQNSSYLLSNQASYFCWHDKKNGIDTIMLTAPTTDDVRLPAVLKYGSGFVYFVSVLGITGTKSATEDAVRTHVSRIRRHTGLPIGVGFGIKTPEQAAAVARHADAAVVGTAIVDRVKMGLDSSGKAKPDLVPNLLAFVKSLADGVRGVTKP